MINPTCVKCHIELVCKLNDVSLVHFIDNDETKGVDALRYGDLYKCPKCGASVVIGLGRQITYDHSTREALERLVRFAREDGKLIELKR